MRHQPKQTVPALVGLAMAVVLLLLLQPWPATAQHPASGAQQPGTRPTLDATRLPLTTQPLATIRAELTATIHVPTTTPTATAIKPFPQVGDEHRQPDYTLLIGLGLLCCYAGALILIAHARTSSKPTPRE